MDSFTIFQQTGDQRFVYFIGTGPEEPVKIGYSWNPRLRLLRLRREVRSDLQVLATKLFDNRWIARAEEKRLHDYFKYHHMHGEWFRLRDPILEFIRGWNA